MATNLSPTATLQESLDGAPRSNGSQVLITGPPGSNSIPKDELESQKSIAQMQDWWREGTGAPLYQQVAVLLVCWKKELDEMQCAEEVEQLGKLFRDSFRYVSKIAELDDQSNGDEQLQKRINKFIKKHDKPDSLIIIYYSGHGWHRKASGKLVLSAKRTVEDTDNRSRSTHPTHAVWEDAEINLIERTDCDVLSILDCCFAGDVHKETLPGENRTYQLISAGGPKKTTPAPGPASFTRSLIRSLTELLQEREGKPFTTMRLVDRISQQKYRQKNRPCLSHRLHRDDRMIWLGPLPEQVERFRPVDNKPSRAFLTIRFALSIDEELTKEQIKMLAKKVTQAIKESGPPFVRSALLSYSKSTLKRTLLRMTDGARAAVRFQRGPKSRLSQFHETLRQDACLITPTSEADVPSARAEGSFNNSGAGTNREGQGTLSQTPRKRRMSSLPDHGEARGEGWCRSGSSR